MMCDCGKYYKIQLYSKMPLPICNHDFVLQKRHLYQDNIWKCRTCPKTITCMYYKDGVFYGNTYNPNNHTHGNTFDNIINPNHTSEPAGTAVPSENNTSQRN